MKKTMLTYKTLDRFEREYKTAHYNADEIETVEHCAYVANMNAGNHPEWSDEDIFRDFLRCLASPYKKLAIIPKNTDPTGPTTTETEKEDTTMYNYESAMQADILDYIADNIDRTDWTGDRDGLEEKLYDDCFIADSVTGNASGSYFCNAYKAREAIAGNLEILADALESFGAEPAEYKKALTSPEYADVTIRCYCLGEYICTVLDELEEAGYFDESEADESDIFETVRAEIA